MKNKPGYGIESVDHALRLALLLQQEGPLRVTDAAERLEVARSTAHRLLAMLVYRDFAEQQPDRRYVAGPVLRRSTPSEPAAVLRGVALPHLEGLTARTGETSNLVVVVADEARFAATVECDQTLRVGDREGRTLPAHLASGGRAALAARDPDEVRALYEESEVDVEALLRDLARIRRQGFAVNNQRTETGVTAIGCVVDRPPGSPATAISLAMPTVRHDRRRLGEWVRQLTVTAERIAADLRRSDQVG
ncbi:IclR family transcriptional regulator [Actinomycetospora termitidis]|uniref:IclR family transcriptional regulator n=1 Tax=Actinomycetospora termitidis TaxID=3053470 RepID=A0ABT7MIB8_9PSEU|nr:IclR family transcriptional regulator [Actinomycetospora sp. Odt1-22]MDL5159058.1 IclR family transcriptional regulator [Actinomycetospora sp. Odt1-22]